MSNSIVMAAQGPFQNAYGLLSKFIDECPEEIWKEKNGGWPVWQQVVHCLSALGFFADKAGDEPIPTPCAPEVGRLLTQGTTPVTKAEVKAYAEKCKARADAYIASLTDADLAATNEALTARIGFPVPHAATLGMLASHTLYHLGSCDAALRDHGIPGVF